MAERSDALGAELRALIDAADRPTGNETSDRIAAAALELFAENGYGGAGTSAIAERAGVTEKTLFRHFGSKAALFARSVYPYFVELTRPIVFDELRSILERDTPDAAALIRSIIMNRVRFAGEHPNAFRVITQGMLMHPEFRELFMRLWSEQLRPGLEHLLARSGSASPIAVESAMRAIVSMTVGYIVDRSTLRPDHDFDDTAEIDAIVRIIVRGILS